MKVGTDKEQETWHELSEVVEIEYIVVAESEYERRICALVKTLLELEATQDNSSNVTKEAS